MQSVFKCKESCHINSVMVTRCEHLIKKKDETESEKKKTRQDEGDRGREREKDGRLDMHTLKQQACDRARRVKVLNGCDYPLTRVHRPNDMHKSISESERMHEDTK